MNKTIGLFIQAGHLLSNGITQQGHYTKLALDACGYNTQLISTEPIHEYNEQTGLETPLRLFST